VISTTYNGVLTTQRGKYSLESYEGGSISMKLTPDTLGYFDYERYYEIVHQDKEFLTLDDTQRVWILKRKK